MAEKKTLTFRMHGLAQERNSVDARQFALKLSALVRGLRKADNLGHGRNCLDYLISDLRMGSAEASIVERQASTKYPARISAIAKLHEVAIAVSQGAGSSLNGSADLLPALRGLSSYASKEFSHIEVFIDENEETAVRVDSFFAEQVVAAREAIKSASMRDKRHYFKGRVRTTLDGTLKAVDHRGTTKLAVLVLTAGGAEIECAYNEQVAPDITPSFDKRCRVEAWAHYDGVSAIPRRLDLVSATPTKVDADLSRWRGAFSIPDSEDEWAD